MSRRTHTRRHNVCNQTITTECNKFADQNHPLWPFGCPPRTPLPLFQLIAIGYAWMSWIMPKSHRLLRGRGWEIGFVLFFYSFFSSHFPYTHTKQALKANKNSNHNIFMLPRCVIILPTFRFSLSLRAVACSIPPLAMWKCVTVIR